MSAHFALTSAKIALAIGIVLLPLMNSNIAAPEPIPTCHSQVAPTGLVTAAKLGEIDQELNSLYAVIHEKQVGYDAPCNYSIPFEGSDTTELILILERFEILRSTYARGLWGYCSVEGANALRHRIENLTNIIKASNGGSPPKVSICNRSQLLACNKTLKVCRCLQDTRNLRNMRAEYWRGRPERCVLSTGSDCPFLPHNNDVKCTPGRYCRYAGNKQDCKLKTNMSLPPGLPANSSFRFRNFTGHYHNPYCRCYGYSPRGATSTNHTHSWQNIILIIVLAIASL